MATKFFARVPRHVNFLGIGAVSAGVIVIVKELVAGGNYEGNEDLSGKTIVITGANRGIGKEAAMGFAKRKARVILACRDMKSCKKVRKEIATETLNKKVVCRECDLASFKSIRAFVQALNEDAEKVDILVNNAGVMRIPIRRFSNDGIELQMATNHFGHFLLTMMLLDNLKSRAPSRIVTVTNLPREQTSFKLNDLNSNKEYDPAQAYYQSKLANVLFTKKLARELEGSGVSCIAVYPGLVNSDLNRHMPYAKSISALFFVRPLMWLLLKTPRQGAQNVLHAALSPDVNTPGALYSNRTETPVSGIAANQTLQDNLWKLSMKWTRLC